MEPSSPNLLVRSLRHFAAKKGTRMAASLAYYGFFALVPLIIILIAVTQLFAQDILSTDIVGSIETLTNPEIATFLENTLTQQAFGNNWIAITISAILVVFAAFKALTELQTSLDDIFESPLPETDHLATVFQQVRNITVLFIVGAISIAFTAGQTLLQRLIDLGGISPDNQLVGIIIGYGLSFIIGGFALATIFRIFPNVSPSRWALWQGAALTSFLLVLGQVAISLYLRFSDVASQFGAASTLAAILIWMYYTALIVFLGASFTHQIDTVHRKKLLESFQVK